MSSPPASASATPPAPPARGVSAWARLRAWVTAEPEYAAQPDFTRQLTRAGALGLLLSLLVSLTLLPRSAQYFPGRVMGISLAVFAVATLVAVTQAVRNPERLGGLRLAGVTSYLLLGVYAVWGDPLAPTTAYAPVTTPLMIGAAAFTVGFGPRRGAAASILLGLAVAHQRALAVGVGQGALEAVMFTGTQMAGAVLIQALLDESRAVIAGYRSLTEMTMREKLANADLAAGSYLDSLVHNHVLATLLTASVASSPAEHDQAAAQARRALALMNRPSPLRRPQEWRDLVQAQADRLGLTLHIAVAGTPRDPASAQALLDATTAALTNVARHSGQREVHVQASFTPRRSTVTVRDEGAGFLPDRISSRRHGVRHGIVARIEDLGGTVAIDSRPGAGTVIRMSLSKTPSVLPVVEFPPVVRNVLFFTICLFVQAAFLAIGWRFREAYPWWLMPLVVLTFGVGLTVLWTIPATSRAWIPVAAAAVVVPTLALAVTDDVTTGDWRLWFVGFFDPVFATVAFRFSARAATLLALAQFPLYVGVIRLTAGSWAPAQAIEATVQLVLWAVVGGHLAWAFSSSTERTLALAAATRRRDDAARLAQANTEALDVRLADLRTRAKGLLEHIAADAGDDAGLADRARVAEAGLRDRLRFPALVDGETLDALGAARARGVQVSLHVDDRAPSIGPALRTAIAAVLEAAEPGDQVTVTAYPTSGAARIVVANPHRAVPVPRCLEVAPVLRLVDHDDGLLVLDVVE